MLSYLNLGQGCSLLQQISPGNKGMLPDLGGEGLGSEQWLWVACLFTRSLHIHSALHMVWIIAAEQYKLIRDGGNFGALTKGWCLQGWSFLSLRNESLFSVVGLLRCIIKFHGGLWLMCNGKRKSQSGQVWSKRLLHYTFAENDTNKEHKTKLPPSGRNCFTPRHLFIWRFIPLSVYSTVYSLLIYMLK